MVKLKGKAKAAFIRKMKKGREAAKENFKKRKKQVDQDIKQKGYLPKIKGYQKCSVCLRKKVGSRDAWFQDFTAQKRICNSCIDELRKKDAPKPMRRR